jgi:Smg protein
MQIKESILDVLLYLFENYFDDELEAVTDQTILETELEAAGFPREEIEHAFDWLADLEERRENPEVRSQDAIRVFADSECLRLNTGCRGFLLHVERLGILSADSRETVIDRLLALDENDIGAEQAKWVILMVLFAQPGQEDAFARMEDLIHDPQGGWMH